jgi:transglutaminase-like putative cysteine protease
MKVTLPGTLRWGGRRFRVLDLAVLAAALLLIVQAPLSVAQAAWVPNLDPLPRIAAVALIVGYLLERTRAPAPVVLPLGAILGFEVITWVYSQVAAVGSLSERIDWLGGRVGDWISTVAGGGVSNDPLVFALAMAALAWVLGLLSAWLLFRDNVPWLVVLINGIALLMNLSYASTSLVGFVGWFAFAACLTLAAHQLASRVELWRRAQLGVNRRTMLNVALGTGLAAGGLLSLAWALPTDVSSPAVAGGWTRLTQPWQGLEGEFDRWFAALNGSDRNARGLSFGRTLAPRGAFDLGDTPVLQVKASAPLYLRATTSDRYAGQAITSSETTSADFGANSDLLGQDQIPLGRGVLSVDIKVLASRTGVAFAPDAPLRFSESTEVDSRVSPDDVATIRLDAPVLQNETYTVVSAISTATVQDLRAAGEAYPEDIKQRYLQLPRTLPRRVIDEAHNVAGGATSAYDRATTIESYLRDNFTYSTHVASVPPDQDWVDYFLFDSKQGYCDYFATAMVVMLRVEGVPARVASGFAPGEFDPDTGISTVRENHAHSWVEAYFPRYGWITFEPSAIRPLPPRVEEQSEPEPVAAPAPSDLPDASGLTPDELDELLNIRDTAPVSVQRPFLTTWPGILLPVFGSILLVLLGAAAVLGLIWRRTFAHLPRYQRPYAQLVRLATWSGTLRPRRSDTPLELAERLGRQVPKANSAIHELTDAYVEGTYAARAPREDPWPVWRDARRAVLRGLFAWRLGGWFGEDTSVAPAPRAHPELLRDLRERQRERRPRS